MTNSAIPPPEVILFQYVYSPDAFPETAAVPPRTRAPEELSGPVCAEPVTVKLPPTDELPVVALEVNVEAPKVFAVPVHTRLPETSTLSQKKCVPVVPGISYWTKPEVSTF